MSTFTSGDGRAAFGAARWPYIRRTGPLRRLWRAGLWQGLLALVFLALGSSAVSYDLGDDPSAAGALSLPACGPDSPPDALRCLSSDAADVLEVVHYGRGENEVYGLRFRCPQSTYTPCGNWADLGARVPLWERVKAGDHVVVVHDALGTAVEVRYFSLTAATVWNPNYYAYPAYQGYAGYTAAADGMAFGGLALFFFWRAFVAATARRRTSRQDRWRRPAALAAVAVLVISPVNEEDPRVPADGWLTRYAVAAAIVVAIEALLLLVRRLRARAAVTRGPEAGAAVAAGGATLAATSGASRYGYRPASATDVERAGGLGSWRIRWLLAQTGAEGRWITDETVVSAADQPHLLPLVTDVARRLGVPVPDAVLLGQRPEVGIRAPLPGGRGVGLSVGLPLALALRPEDLRIAVAHALAVLREPDPVLAARLVALRQRYADHLADPTAPLHAIDPATAKQLVMLTRRYGTDLDGFAAGARAARDGAWLLDRTAAFARDIETRADDAARRVCGSATDAATALLRVAVLRADFEAFSRGFVPTRDLPFYPAALYSGWAATLPTGVVHRWGPWHGEDIGETMSRHAGLAATVRTLDPSAWAYTVTDPPVPPIVRVDTATEADLSARWLRGQGGVLADLEPVDWSDIDAEDGYAPAPVEPHAAAARLLGRPAGPDDVLDLVAAGRGPELAALWTAMNETARDADDAGGNDSDGGSEPDGGNEPDGGSEADGGGDGQPDGTPLTPSQLGPAQDRLLAQTLTAVLRERGYRPRDVLQPYLLTGPDGDRVDVAEVVGTGTPADAVARVAGVRAVIAASG